MPLVPPTPEREAATAGERVVAAAGQATLATEARDRRSVTVLWRIPGAPARTPPRRPRRGAGYRHEAAAGSPTITAITPPQNAVSRAKVTGVARTTPAPRA